jgi:hypothetical protein
MPKSRFRVKRYSHPKYKFVVRGKIQGKWKRRYFQTEAEAIAFAEEQNAEPQATDSYPASQPNGDRQPGPTGKKIPLERSRPAGSAMPEDLSKLVSPTYFGPRIQRYLGDSWCMHLPFAYDLMRELAPKVFVELGVKEGESYFAFCQSAAENKINVKCYGVDSWRGDIQTGNLDPNIQQEVINYNWRYSSFSELKPMLFAEALGDFPDASIELLHIDGAHTYDDVKSDFVSWLPKVSPDGLVLFHDVMPRDRGFGVWKVWEEIAREHNAFLFEFGFGLGVWKKRPVASSDSSFVRGLFLANEAERRDINESYANDAAALALWHNLARNFASRNQDPLFISEEDRPADIARLQNVVASGETQTAEVERALEEKSRQVIHFQHELEQKTDSLAQAGREIEEKTKHIGLLQSELEEKIKQVTHFKGEGDGKAKQLIHLQSALEQKNDRLARASIEIVDARWEVLTLRGTLSRATDSADTPARILQLEGLLEMRTSEREHLRAMLAGLQNDIEKERLTGQAKEDELRAIQAQLKATEAELRATKKHLRSEQREMNRLTESFWGKLILPFGRSQQRLQALRATDKTND